MCEQERGRRTGVEMRTEDLFVVKREVRTQSLLGHENHYKRHHGNDRQQNDSRNTKKQDCL